MTPAAEPTIALPRPRKLSATRRAKILVVAREVRTWAACQQARWPKHYTPAMRGLCAVASRKLFRELRRAGFDPWLVIFISTLAAHSYVCIDGWVLDVTATQFLQAPIEFVASDRIEPGREFWWQATAMFKSERGLMDYQRRNDAPELEVALPKKP